MKIILQELCRLKLGWDDTIPDEYRSAWLRWLEDLPKLSQLSIPCCCKPSDFEVKPSELHHFADASESGYGSESYLRQESHDERIHCSLVLGKARVTPLKTISIPRLELSAATVSVRIDSMLQKELDIPLKSTTFWTDSTAVIRYVENENRRFQTFVANCHYSRSIKARGVEIRGRYVESCRFSITWLDCREILKAWFPYGRERVVTMS